MLTMTTKRENKVIEMERNWADLPPELFRLLLKRLPEIGDFIRCRAVCKPWRASSSVSDLAPQFPWIVKRSEGPDLHFYSMALNKLYIIRSPISSGYRFFGPAGCYMVTGQEGNVDSFSLRNPLNNSEVTLPIPHDCDPSAFPSIFSSECFHLSFQTDNYMLISEYKRSVGCKLGGDRWDIIGPGHECGDGYENVCFYVKGLLLRFWHRTCSIEIIDISSSKELYVIPLPEEFSKMMPSSSPYFVESCGEILMFYSITFFHCLDEKRRGKFYIYRLEVGIGKGSPSWVKLSSIGDRILFFQTPFDSYHGFCLKASDFTGLKENCIYYVLTRRIRYTSRFYGHFRIYMYDIENNETTFTDTPFNRDDNINWFMPTLNHI